MADKLHLPSVNTQNITTLIMTKQLFVFQDISLRSESLLIIELKPALQIPLAEEEAPLLLPLSWQVYR